MLTETGTRIGTFAGKRINYQAAEREIRKITGTPTNPPVTTPPTTTPPTTTPPDDTEGGDTGDLGGIDNELYKGNVDIVINFNSNTPTISATNLSPLASFNSNIKVTNVRDLELSFDGQYYASNNSIPNPAAIAGFDIEVNGIRRITFNSLQPYGSNYHYKKHSFMLNRNWLQSGENTIRIKKSSLNPSSARGIIMLTSMLRMDYNDPVPMTLGQKITSVYGHKVGSKKHLTGLRVEFPSPTQDVKFNATGYDFDWGTEIAVFFK